MSTKRASESQPEEGVKIAKIESTTEETAKNFFLQFKTRLDISQDERSQVINISRDVTAASKKIIFALHRVKKNGQEPLSMASDVQTTLASQYKLIASKFAEINSLVGNSTNVYWKYSRQVSGASEEMIEAMSFQFWLEKGQIMTLEELHEMIKLHNIDVYVHPRDYISGLFDLTGELMRYGTLNKAHGLPIVALLREFEYSVFVLTGDPNLVKKIEVFQQSLAKLERLLYDQSLQVSEVV
ncbi:hypothetical protein CJU90_5743 [Yarrowia sp. C11]|nr:hypothetical protein CJU90_5743 [Yarrowia sp. C11]KAG5364324.1 hypothetical protein CKK34_3121 [Yarrowia sp. E02]